jgi:cysteine-rich repeat protein
MILLLAGTCPRLADAGIDVTGAWYLLLVGQPKMLVHVVQTGTSLRVEEGGPTQFGTIDSATGVFTLAIIQVSGGSCGTGLTGTVSPDGRTLAGSVYLIGPPPGCMSIDCFCTGSTLLGALYGSRAPCGDGVVDPGEQCDDGNLAPGDCCALGCTLEPAGTACADDGDACTNDLCDAAGTCTHPAAPAPTCAQAGPRGGTLALVHTSGLRRDHVHFRWSRGPAVAMSDFGNPTTTTRYALCVYDEVNGVPSSPYRGEPGGTCGRTSCWRQVPNGWSFTSRPTTPNDLTRVVLHAGGAGKATLAATADRADLALVPFPLRATPAVVAQLRTTTGACWGATFSTRIKRNDATGFIASSE